MRAAWAWAALALATSSCNGWQHQAVATHPQARSVGVRVVAADGSGLSGARVSLAGQTATTGADGAASFDAIPEGGYLIGAELAGYQPGLLAASVAADGAGSFELGLLPAEGSDVHLLFTGDLSFDQGIDDPNRDGIPDDALVSQSDPAAGASKLLAAIAPVFERFDLVTGTLATSLGDGATPHPTKSDRALAPAGIAAALLSSRVDALNLANDHAYDYLDDGLRQTLSALDRTEELRFGAGRDDSEAKIPLLQLRLGLAVGQIGVSALVGRAIPPAKHDLAPLFAADTGKGGVIEATTTSVRTAVERVVGLGDVSVAHIAAGQTWSTDASQLKPLADAAAAAGASLVVGHGPRTMLPLMRSGEVYVAGGLGQLVFGGNRPEARFGVLLEAMARHRRIEQLRVWPIELVHYQPQLAAGELARRIVRKLGALSQLAGGALVFPERGHGAVAPDAASASVVESPHRQTSDLAPLGSEGATNIVRLLSEDPDGYAASVGASLFSGTERDLQLELGRELLWNGGFEDQTAGGPGLGWGAGWLFRAPDVGPSDASVHGGRLAMELVRKSGNLGPATTRAAGLQSLATGKRYTFSGCWRIEGQAQAQASIALYPSRALHVQPIARVAVAPTAPTKEWSCFAADYLSPLDGLATVEIALDPPDTGTARLFVDDLSLIEWDDPLPAAAQLPVPNDYEYLRCRAASPGGRAALQWVTRRFSTR